MNDVELEKIAAEVAALGDALVAVMDRHRRLSERVRTLLAPDLCPCAACATAKKYAGREA